MTQIWVLVLLVANGSGDIFPQFGSVYVSAAACQAELARRQQVPSLRDARMECLHEPLYSQYTPTPPTTPTPTLPPPPAPGTPGGVLIPSLPMPAPYPHA